MAHGAEQELTTAEPGLPAEPRLIGEEKTVRFKDRSKKFQDELKDLVYETMSGIRRGGHCAKAYFISSILVASGMGEEEEDRILDNLEAPSEVRRRKS